MDRLRPGGAAERGGWALRDARRFLGRCEGRLEPAFLKALPGLVEEVFHPIKVNARFPAEQEPGFLRGRDLRLEFHQDLRGRVGRGESLDQIGLLLEAIETHPMSFADFAELAGPPPLEPRPVAPAAA